MKLHDTGQNVPQRFRKPLLYPAELRDQSEIYDRVIAQSTPRGCASRSASQTTLLGAGLRQSIEPFMLDAEICRAAIRGNGDDVHAVEVGAAPIRHRGRIAAVRRKQRPRCRRDDLVLPGDEDELRAALVSAFSSAAFRARRCGNLMLAFTGRPNAMAVGSIVASGLT